MTTKERTMNCTGATPDELRKGYYLRSAAIKGSNVSDEQITIKVIDDEGDEVLETVNKKDRETEEKMYAVVREYDAACVAHDKSIIRKLKAALALHEVGLPYSRPRVDADIQALSDEISKVEAECKRIREAIAKGDYLWL